jgi:phage N-6-adenine-methyltransferase
LSAIGTAGAFGGKRVNNDVGYDPDAYETPQDRFDEWNAEFNFDLDAAADDNNHKCDEYFTIETDGLKQSWAGRRVFANIPFSAVDDWLCKAEEEQNSAQIIVILVKADTSTQWWHDHWEQPEIRFLKRIQFVPPPGWEEARRAAGKSEKIGSPNMGHALFIYRPAVETYLPANQNLPFGKFKLLTGDALEQLKRLPSESVQMCCTSPPYFNQRDYGIGGQIGLEKDVDSYINRVADVFEELHRVLKNDGVFWLNIGDTFSSGGRGGGGSYIEERKDKIWKGQSEASGWRSKPQGYRDKELLCIPWLLALELRQRGWLLRMDNIWHKTTAQPESVKDRCTRAHEYVFQFTKQESYYFDADAIREPCVSGNGSNQGVISGKRFGGTANAKGAASGYGVRQFVNPTNGKNKRSVWSMAGARYKGKHCAVFPNALSDTCVLAGSRPGDLVIDPFAGSCTVGVSALLRGRNFVGIELNPESVLEGEQRIRAEVLKEKARRQRA